MSFFKKITKKVPSFNTCTECYVPIAKPQVALTAPNCDHFARVSLTVLDFFGCNCQS